MTDHPGRLGRLARRSPRRKPEALRRRALPFLASALLSHCANSPVVRGGGGTGPIAELARAGVARSIEPRLSIPLAYRPCSVEVPEAGGVPRARCPAAGADPAPSRAIVALAEQASRRLRVAADPEALHAAALIDLLWSGGNGIPLERSVSYLRTASRIADHPAPVLTDLAAALMVRAERRQSPRDLLEAVEAADKALDLEPGSEAARFNLALGLERLGLDGQAWRAWKAFLQVDSTSRWAEEARGRSRAPRAAPEPPAPPVAGAAAAEISAYAAAAPEAAMLFGWDHALDEWGAAAMAGDANHADSLLRFTAALGAALEQRGRDATLADAVRAIEAAAGRRPAKLALARAHHAYALGRTAYRRGDYAAAERLFERALATPGRSAPLAAWARFQRAAALAYQGRLDAAEPILRQVLGYADPARYPSLAGRARWVLGTISLRRGRYEQAIGAVEAAARLFERAGERENLGTVQDLSADARHYLADPAAEYAAIAQALVTLRPFRPSVWLYNLLYIAARFAAADGLPQAALRLQDEGVEVADSLGQPMPRAEARIARARLRAAAGRDSGAREDLRAARAAVDALEPGPARDWAEADLRLTEAGTALAAEPARAIAALDSAARFWASQHNQIRLLPVLVARSEAALELGKVPAATADLDRALGMLDQQSAGIRSIALRASLLDAAQHVVDRLVMLRVGSGLPAEALADLEKVRVSTAPARRRPRGEPPAPLAAPPGQVAAEYALVGDTLLVWTITGGTVRLARSTVDRAGLVRAIERVRASLELRADEAALASDLAALYDQLLRPIDSPLGPPGTPLVLIADGEIAGVPFAALRDTVRGRYLIEQHPLRFATSLRDAARPPGKPPLAGANALLVADPAFDRRAFPGLGRLPGAADEVRAIAAQYPDTVVLAGAAATPAAFEAALGHAAIVHFAGHSLFDDERPEQSLLVLAPGGAAGGGGRVTAAELEGLDLTHVGLVVLSACETIRSRSGRSGGFAGLAGAFLAAGAGGVVGSLWRVDDRLTRELMSEFHRAYRQSGDGAAALRAAQLTLLHSPESGSRAPAAWAGFRYAGR